MILKNIDFLNHLMILKNLFYDFKVNDDMRPPMTKRYISSLMSHMCFLHNPI